MRPIVVMAFMAFAPAGLSAHADSFKLAFGSSSNSFHGAGVLTTGALQAPGEYALVSVTGTAVTVPGSQDIAINSILAPGTFPTIANGGTFPANDNVLFVTNGVGRLDGNGLAFILSDGAQVNLYDPQGSAYDALLKQPNGTDLFEQVPVTITAVAATPEPSSFTLIGTGLLGVAAAIKRRLA